jgi:hypothetical protein
LIGHQAAGSGERYAVRSPFRYQFLLSVCLSLTADGRAYAGCTQGMAYK